MNKSILFAASDVGAAQHMAPLIKSLHDAYNWDVYTYASEDAGKVFEPLETGTFSPESSR